MAVITRRTYRWVTLSGVDLLESGAEREPVSVAALARRVPPWAVALTAALALVAGLLVAVDQRREADRPDVAVRLLDGRSSTVAGVALGGLELLLVNLRGRPARLGGLVLEVEGLRVTGLEPALPDELRAYDEQRVRVTYTVPSCAALVLPGVLVLQVDDEQERVPVVDAGSGSAGIELGSCPPGARSRRPGDATDVGARAAGGTARRVGDAVEGVARLEVRNAGPPVRLLSVDAEVPGVAVTPRVLDGGRTIVTDGLVVVGLRFRIADCAELQETGRLVLRVERFGGVQELSLALASAPGAGGGPQLRLPVVLDSCG